MLKPIALQCVGIALTWVKLLNCNLFITTLGRTIWRVVSGPVPTESKGPPNGKRPPETVWSVLSGTARLAFAVCLVATAFCSDRVMPAMALMLARGDPRI